MKQVLPSQYIVHAVQLWARFRAQPGNEWVQFVGVQMVHGTVTALGFVLVLGRAIFTDPWRQRDVLVVFPVAIVLVGLDIDCSLM